MATDVLAEGLNLQQSRHIINFAETRPWRLWLRLAVFDEWAHMHDALLGFPPNW